MSFITSPVNLSNPATYTGTLPYTNGGTGLTTTGTAANVLTSTGTGWSSTTPTSGGITWITKSANYTAANGDYIQADTTSTAFTITLPATPSANNTVYIQDSKGTWATNNLTIAPGANNIMGQAGNLTVNQSGTGFGLIYNGTEWRIF